MTMATGEEQRAEHLPLHLLNPPHDNWEFNLFLDKLAQNIDEEELKRLKYFEYGPDGIRKKLFEEMKTTHEFFIYLQEMTILSVDNLVHLQAMLWHLDRKDLVKECAQYAETVPNTLYFHQPSPKPVNGYRHAAFHVEGQDLGKYKREHLEKLRNILSRRLGVPHEFIIISGLTPSKSLVITVMIPVYNAEFLVELLQENRLAELAELGIDSVLINDQTFIISEISSVLISKEQNETAELVEKLERSQSLLEQCNIDLLRLRKKLQTTEERLRNSCVPESESHLREKHGLPTGLPTGLDDFLLLSLSQLHAAAKRSERLRRYSLELSDRDIAKLRIRLPYDWTSDENNLVESDHGEFLELVLKKEISKQGEGSVVNMPSFLCPLFEKIGRQDLAKKYFDESMRIVKDTSIEIDMRKSRGEEKEVISREKSTREKDNPKDIENNIEKMMYELYEKMNV